MSSRAALRPLATAALFALLAFGGACELVFPAGDLSRGTGGTGATSGSTASSTGAGGCSRNDQCDDGDPCTSDICEHGRCRNPKEPNLVCAAAHGCIPASRCDAKGKCPVPVPDDAACDDMDPCTDDACLPSGKCANTPKAEGTKCFDGTACGVCSGTSHQCNETFLDDICTGTAQTCPPDQFIALYDCVAGCGGYPMCMYCVNAARCQIPCLKTFKACCALGPDCSAPCPSGYTVVPNSQQSDPGCACGSTQAASVMCTQ